MGTLLPDQSSERGKKSLFPRNSSRARASCMTTRMNRFGPAKRQVPSTHTLTPALLNLPSGQVVLQVEAFQSMETWNFYDSNLHALLWLACPVQSANALHRKQLSFQLSGPTRISFTEHSLAIQTDYRNCSLTVQCLSMTWSTFNLFFSFPIYVRAKFPR